MRNRSPQNGSGFLFGTGERVPLKRDRPIWVGKGNDQTNMGQMYQLPSKFMRRHPIFLIGMFFVRNPLLKNIPCRESLQGAMKGSSFVNPLQLPFGENKTYSADGVQGARGSSAQIFPRRGLVWLWKPPVVPRWLSALLPICAFGGACWLSFGHKKPKKASQKESPEHRLAQIRHP